MEDYKQKYEQAIEDIKKIKDANKDNKELVDFIEYKYPELKDSEDEKIRKELIKYLERRLHTSFNQEAKICKDGIAWLEKQGNRKSVDKVEPKFKVGDWVVYCNEDVDLITGVGETGYIINKGSGYIPFVCEDEMRLWTIQDAKDGDVLVDDNSIIIFRSIGNYRWNDVIDYYVAYKHNLDEIVIQRDDSHYGTVNTVTFKPATKKQRNLLFKKMKEAGYEWDVEKKELKKIEQNHAWSDEDEKFFKTAIWHLSHSISDGKSTDIHSDTTAWLKTLKQRMKGE